MGTPLILAAAAALAATPLAPAATPLGVPVALAATPSPVATVSSAGTSFLTAVAISAGQPVRADAVTGDYLYWSFTATAGQQPDLTAKVTLPAAADRHGSQSWIIEVFDGLRRRQACVAGEQSPVADPAASEIALGCRLRQVRSWAEPSDGDPLPGTYYVRVSGTALPEQDLGLPLRAELSLAAPDGDTGADQGELKAPLTPANRPGAVLAAAPTAEAEEEEERNWLPALSSRWFWTAGGGVLAAAAGLVGFAWTRPRRRA